MQIAGVWIGGCKIFMKWLSNIADVNNIHIKGLK